MAVELIVEDGTGVANANSYVTLEEARAYAENRGVVLSSDDDTLAAQLIRATDYLEMFALRYVGTPVDIAQALSWPRADVVFDNTDFPETEIPKVLKTAQIRLAMEIHNGVDIMPTTTGKFVKREKVGPIETEYSESVNVDSGPSFPYITALLETLFNTSTGFALTTIRV